MTDSVVSELMILVLLLIVNFRVFAGKQSQSSVFVIFAPAALLLSILLCFAWKPDIPIMAVLTLSVLVCITNIHSLARLLSRLFVDHYSPALYITSIINIILIFAAGAALVMYRPVPVQAGDFGAIGQKILLTGSYRAGFSERERMFETRDAELLRFLPENTQEPLPLVLFVTDPRGTAESCMPFAAALASLGYEVIAVDFNVSLIGSGAARVKALLFPERFEEEKPDYIRDSVMQYIALFDLYGRSAVLSGRSVFLAGEGINRQAVFGAAAAEPDIASGIYSINGGNSADAAFSVPGWFNGYGAIRQTAPWLCILLTALNHPAAVSAGLPVRDTSCADSILAAEQAHLVFMGGINDID